MSWSTIIWFSLNFVFFLQENVGHSFFGQHPDNSVEHEYFSIFVDKCTVKFIIGVFQRNAKIKTKTCMLKKLLLGKLIKTNNCLANNIKTVRISFQLMKFPEGDVASFLVLGSKNCYLINLTQKIKCRCHMFVCPSCTFCQAGSGGIADYPSGEQCERCGNLWYFVVTFGSLW